MKIDDKNLTVRQSNSLIEASYRLSSVAEGRLIRALIAQIQPADEDFKLYRISISDFAKLFGIGDSTAYEQIKRAADELAGRRIMLENNGSWLRMNWLSLAEYEKGSGYIQLRFEQKLKPYLLQLKRYFTQYELENVVTFKSGYSIRLYELLKAEQFKAGDGGYFFKSFEYEELRLILGIDDSEYTFFKDFRVRIIDPAVREINAGSNLHVIHVDYKKTGRRYTGIDFHCEPMRQQRLDVDEPHPTIESVPKEKPEDIKEMVAFGIEENTAYKWRKKYGVRHVIRNIAYTKAMQKAGKIRDSLTGFLARAIADNLGGGWEEEEKRREQLRKDQERQERMRLVEEAKQSDANRKQYEAIGERFEGLSEEEREGHRVAFEAQLSDFHRGRWIRAKEQGPRPELSSPMLRAMFFKFFDQSSQSSA